ncbi:sodium-coupled monocarboxylate transporter 2-like [Photinus pyralis]|uniref:sodium-coupled monocarboxylate transporter 2-like n=1 Tax=Photinus pyralis TaxID=7054 RepID=UPI00126722B1|nr:sodium-coupled monocarboxylate transporter 2-like [Photinus pyralis]
MWATFVENLGVNPSSVQRFLSLTTYTAVKRAAIVFGVGTAITKVASCWIGFILFATYMDCDPFSLGKINRVAQMLPYYLPDVGRIKGLPGLLVAGVCGTALSSTNEDFLRSSHISRRTTSRILKIIVVVSGLLCLGLIFVIEKLGGVVQIFLSFHAVTHGPLLGLISLGMLFPIGALWGGIVSSILTAMLVFGAQAYIFMGRVKHEYKPMSTEHCVAKFTIISKPSEADPEKPPLTFQISFHFYTLISVGVLVGWWTRKKDDPKVDRDLLSPVIYRFLSRENSAQQELATYESIEKALANVTSGADEEKVNK